MNEKAIDLRLKGLLQDCQGTKDYEVQNRVRQGTLGMMQLLYGRDSNRERDLSAELDRIAKLYYPSSDGSSPVWSSKCERQWQD